MRIVLVLALWMPFMAGAQRVNKSTTAKWLSLEQEDYVVQYPENWELDQSGQMGAEFILFAPQSTATDDFRENVNLMLQDLTGYNLDLDGLIELSERQISAALSNSNILLSERVTIAEGEYHKLLYTADMAPYQLKFEQYCRVIDNTAVILTFTCEIDMFNTYREVGERILNSFKWKL
jgi:hypothetical protein